jgi:hypothetical protein
VKFGFRTVAGASSRVLLHRSPDWHSSAAGRIQALGDRTETLSARRSLCPSAWLRRHTALDLGQQFLSLAPPARGAAVAQAATVIRWYRLSSCGGAAAEGVGGDACGAWNVGRSCPLVTPSFSAEAAKDICAQQSRIGEPRLCIMNIDAVHGGGLGGSDRPAALPQVKRSRTERDGYIDFRKLNLNILKIICQCVPCRDDLGD